jgi:hypothetical protein
LKLIVDADVDVDNDNDGKRQPKEQPAPTFEIHQENRNIALGSAQFLGCFDI